MTRTGTRSGSTPTSTTPSPSGARSPRSTTPRRPPSTASAPPLDGPHPGPGGSRLGVFLDCGHGPQVLFVEAFEDEPAEGAGDTGHGDVQDQPAGHPGAGVLCLE